ncbi:MAG: HDIG domain-containing protein [Gemmatimonadetes bacterium]|uniref:HDIG domain-containing protein n=1 Tax=Candidatus Kutchimonas denitrificans TaxID=3056748 RepID=A0AAE4Z6Q5_9BACT|nr:HDIG domain-containing protein [Gemmatimonadota bacterium]NIR74618.1 HDIG domain-containing protein [Candidatus Kutchimonas denitrificans]NIS02808.1 HDIG domain-containing protein [Gemmatimonadota bacterium]NIT68969.1 HDIG domain-containing protein [Gemmatimonadota bacterium]NIU52274.1 HDIG domain-containing protein [Gemmatimonadota bacterium]
MSDKKKRRTMARVRYLLRQIPRSGDMTRNKELYRVVLLLVAAVAVDLAFPVSRAPQVALYEPGVIADQDVIAPITFPVSKSDDELGRERAEAASAVPPIFDYRPQFADSSIARVSAFFAAVDSIASASGELDRARAIQAMLAEANIPAPEAGAAVLMSEDTRRQLRSALNAAFDDNLREGVVSSGDLGGFASQVVILRRDTVESLIARDSLDTKQGFYQEAADHLPSDVSLQERRLYNNLAIRFADATLRLNREATAVAREQAQQAVETTKYEVLEGEIIVRAHERVGEAQAERLNALRDALITGEAGEDWPAHVGGVLFNVLLLIVFGVVLRYYRPDVYASDRSITLLWILLLAVAGTAALISRAAWPPQLIPIAFAALVIATLYDGVLALLAVFVIVGLVVARPPIQAVVFFPMLIGGAAAALSGRVVRRRAYTWASAAIIAVAYVLAAVSLALVARHEPVWALGASFWGTLNAVGSTMLAAGFMPLAESITRQTTDQSLLELADLNRPLLRRLSLEAPGTYAHSINVANLAEAAAREIGANSLLTRVGVYYHDIGKVKKPQFFVENQPRGRNPHDKMKPATSANIVREHVKDGLEMSEEASVPEVVLAFIREHHGTQKIGFFMEKAAEADPRGVVEERDFRYPGPKPQSRETAIVLLADSVESAARVLQDPTPESIEELVDRIVGLKMAEGQLDEAPLTLREISVVKAQFVKVLTGMYHHRLDYPLQNRNTVAEQQPATHGTP